MLKPFSKDTSGRLNRRFPEEWNETIFTLFWKIIFTCLSSSPAGWSSSFSCVSTIFEKNCPADAVCARYGGEEFAMILPGNTPKTTAEHIRLEFSSRLFDTPMGEKTFTISLGTAVYDRPYAGATLFFEKANQALYEAKRSGKNRVV